MKSNIPEDIWKRVNVGLEDECWEYQGSFSSSGYGQFSYKNKNCIAHRFIYKYFISDPGKLKVCHSCDNRKCCNPKHLWLGTSLDNMKDAKDKKRLAYGEKNSQSKLNEELVRFIKEELKNKQPTQIGRELNINPGLIQHIKKNIIWTHVNIN